MSIDMTMNHTTAAERAERKQRALALTIGARGADGLTDRERDLLAAVHAAGYAIATGRDANERSAPTWTHPRVVGRRIA